MLSAEKIKQNLDDFYHKIGKLFPTRKDNIIAMYKDLGEERLAFAPASSFNYFHNAFPGGYVDHILRVMEFSYKMYSTWRDLGMNVSNFTIEELLFAAAHHDLGKLGQPGEGNEYYLINDSEWHRKNLGKEFKRNEAIQNFPIQDGSLYLLQYYDIKLSFNEYLGIKIHDGMYDEANKPILAGFNLDQKLKTNLPIILHHADYAAARFEFERWKGSK